MCSQQGECPGRGVKAGGLLSEWEWKFPHWRGEENAEDSEKGNNITPKNGKMIRKKCFQLGLPEQLQEKLQELRVIIDTEVKKETKCDVSLPEAIFNVKSFPDFTHSLNSTLCSRGRLRF